MKKYMLDRFEGYWAVCYDEEDNEKVILKEELPKNVKEGFTIYEENGVFKIDLEDTERRRRIHQERVNRILEMNAKRNRSEGNASQDDV